MTARTVRLVAGVVGILVLISYAPSVSDLTAALGDPTTQSQLGDLLGFAALAAGLSVVTIGTRRRLVRRRKAPRSPRRDTGLGMRIREATRATGTPRVPELARRFGTSQDAIRIALGRTPTPAGAGGTSFRNRQQTPRQQRATGTAVARPRAYRALA
ncbi:MAG TPA: hypothetical protein VMG41_04410 [Gemmatimonadales bacterium]|nr:hypothetical protein [Gemmatimonadales bacterium]